VNGPSRGGILVCEECGQRVVLDGPLSAWYSGSTPFGCECGEGKPLVAIPLIPLRQDHQGRSASLEPGIGGGEP
jgi:hypothetical protein